MYLSENHVEKEDNEMFVSPKKEKREFDFVDAWPKPRRGRRSSSTLGMVGTYHMENTIPVAMGQTWC